MLRMNGFTWCLLSPYFLDFTKLGLEGRQRSIDIKAVMIKNGTLIRTEGDISESENHEQHFVGF